MPAPPKSFPAGAKQPCEALLMNALFVVLIWCVLFAFSWPLALLALALWPVIWLLTLPLVLMGIAVGAVFALVKAVLFLPARLLGRRC